MTFNGEIFGLPIPDAGPIFAAALALHILSASSEYRLSGGHCAASPEPQPTSQATIRRMLAVLTPGLASHIEVCH